VSPLGGGRARVAVAGLDGATFRLLDPLLAQGAMPHLQKIIDRGVRAVLKSTVPTYTPPAWVSMITGVNPGRHGVFGFLDTTPQEPPQLAHSGLIDAAPIWLHLGPAGIRSGIFNVPISYPPMPVEGFMISGGLAAGWANTEMPNFASDIDLGRLVTQIAGGSYPLDTPVSYENDWASPTVATRIESVQRLRHQVLTSLLGRNEVDFVFAVFEGPDRLQHLHYQYLVEGSSWYQRPEAGAHRDRASSFFSEVDRSIGSLIEWAGPDGHVIVVSDHGFGPWEKTLNVNLLLEQWGYLRLPSISRVTRLRSVAGTGQRVVRRVIPRRMLQSLKSRVGRGIAWEQSRAFSSHVAEQGIHINVRGELPRGCVDAGDAGRIATELKERLLELRDPSDGEPVVDRVVTREEAVAGPHSKRAPHLFPFCRDQRYELSDTLAASSILTDHRDRPWGYHHEDGVFVGSGPGLLKGSFSAGLDIVDVMPIALHLMGQPIPEGLDGKVPMNILSGEAKARPVAVSGSRPAHQRREENPYSAEEEASIEESLRGLGYIE